MRGIHLVEVSTLAAQLTSVKVFRFLDAGSRQGRFTRDQFNEHALETTLRVMPSNLQLRRSEVLVEMM